MKFVEIDLFGVYVAPVSVLMIAAWVATIGLRRLAVRVGLLDWVWHPALFVFAAYVVILWSLTFVAAHGPRVLP